MPRIPTFDAGNLALQPTERGVDANLQAARRTASFFNEAAGMITSGAQARSTAQNDIDRSFANVADATATFAKQQDEQFGHREISMGAAAGAQLFDNLNNQWNETVKNADPNDPSVAAKFRETVLEPSLQTFKESYSNTDLGTRWSEQHVESMRNQMFRKTAADMSTLAGDAIRVNVRNFSNLSVNTAFKSPDQVDFLLDKTDADVAAIVNTSPNIKGADSARLRTDIAEKTKESIVKAGALGAIANSSDPEKTAQDFVDRYPQYITRADAQVIAANAKQQVRAARTDENYRRHNEDLERKRVSEVAENGLLKKVYSDDPKEAATVSTRSIVNDDRLTNPTKEKLINLVNREMKPESDAKVSAATSRDLFTRIYLPADDPNKITDTGPIIQARIDGKLTKSDFNDLRQEIANSRTPEGEKLGTSRNEFMKRWAPMIDGAMTDAGIHSLLGTQKTYQFMQDARRQEEVLRTKGLDPHLAYDPRSEYFVGKMDNIAKYHVTLQEAQAYKATFGEMSKKIRGNLTDEPPPMSVQTVNAPPVPPAAQREVGKVYELPKGRFKWNGGGWEK